MGEDKKRKLETRLGLILGVLCSTTPILMGYGIQNWQWWAIAIPTGFVLSIVTTIILGNYYRNLEK